MIELKKIAIIRTFYAAKSLFEFFAGSVVDAKIPQCFRIHSLINKKSVPESIK